eukprot:11201788-Lingulodinium_polyedra.AAC.1
MHILSVNTWESQYSNVRNGILNFQRVQMRCLARRFGGSGARLVLQGCLFGAGSAQLGAGLALLERCSGAAS